MRGRDKYKQMLECTKINHYKKISKNEGGRQIINKISQNINKISQNINKISQDANFFENVKKKYYGYKIHVEQKLKK